MKSLTFETSQSILSCNEKIQKEELKEEDKEVGGGGEGRRGKRTLKIQDESEKSPMFWKQ